MSHLRLIEGGGGSLCELDGYGEDELYDREVREQYLYKRIATTNFIKGVAIGFVIAVGFASVTLVWGQ